MHNKVVHVVFWSLGSKVWVSLPDDLCSMQDIIRMTHNIALCHPDEIIYLIHKSPGWLNYYQYLVRMTYVQWTMSSGWHTKLPEVIRMEKRNLNPKSPGWGSSWSYLIRMTYGHWSMSSGWLTMSPYVILMRWLIWSVSHPDDLTIVSISSPDDLTIGSISSEWLDHWRYLIRTT